MVWLIVVIVFALLAALLVLLALWVRWLWQRASTRRRVLVIVLLSPLIGGLQVMIGFIRGFGAVGGEAVDPSQKARILAEGISEAMNCIVFGAAVAVVPLLVGLLVLTWMERRSKRTG